MTRRDFLAAGLAPALAPPTPTHSTRTGPLAALPSVRVRGDEARRMVRLARRIDALAIVQATHWNEADRLNEAYHEAQGLTWDGYERSLEDSPHAGCRYQHRAGVLDCDECKARWRAYTDAEDRGEQVEQRGRRAYRELCRAVLSALELSDVPIEGQDPLLFALASRYRAVGVVRAGRRAFLAIGLGDWSIERTASPDWSLNCELVIL